MTAATTPAGRFSGDPAEAFFAERATGRRGGRRRSLARAAALAARLGLDAATLAAHRDRTLAVVGSKGKGTAATYASAVLHGAGLRVGTLTSPGFRSNRERIRVDGRAIAPRAYAALVTEVAGVAADAAPGLPDDGYLSPTGLFTLAALRHFQATGCDAWVLEAGMGGRHDEIALAPAAVVAVTAIFGEHLGILGASVTEIAAEKLGVAGPGAAVLAAPQRHPQAAAAVAAWRRPSVQVLPDGAGLPGLPQPIRESAAVGVAAAGRLLSLAGMAADAAAIDHVVARVRLPGRLSLHERGAQRWLVDCATNGSAAAAALARCRAVLGEPSAVLLCVPDGKDARGAAKALAGTALIPVRTDAPHLRFDAWGRALPSLAELDPGALGKAVLALGTVHFAGDVLELLGVSLERAFSR